MEDHTKLYDQNVIMVPMTTVELSNALNLIPEMKLSEFCKMNGLNMDAMLSHMRDGEEVPLWMRSWLLLAASNPQALNSVRMMMDATVDVSRIAEASRSYSR